MKDVNEGYICERSEEGLKHVQWIYIWEEGDVYDGDWANDKQEGYGVYEYATGSKYEGYWLIYQRHGKGKYSEANGNVYEGDYVDDMMHGIGKATLADGTIYHDGEWRNNEPYHNE